MSDRVTELFLAKRLRVLQIVAVLLLAGLCNACSESPLGPGHGRADEVHLSWAASPATSMAIAWHTSAKTASDVIVEDHGRWRLVKGRVSSPPPLGVGMFHEADVTDLEPGVTYRYAVDGVGGRSVARSFTTAPNGAGSFRFDVFADQGNCHASPAACRVIAGIVADHPAFVIGAGDLSYANEHGLPSWDLWLNEIESYAADVPLMTTAGNHEFIAGDPTSKYKDPITNYKGRFVLPSQQNEDYYSFNYSGVHFVALPEIYVRIGPGSDFQRWLTADLAAADRDPNVRWTVAFDHRPFYSSGTRHGSYHSFDRNELPILEKYHVALVISGHEHNYERTLPSRGGVATSRNRTTSTKGQGTIYVVTGGGGANIYNDFGPMPAIDATRAVKHEHLRIDVSPGSLRVVAISDFGKVIDRFTISAP